MVCWSAFIAVLFRFSCVRLDILAEQDRELGGAKIICRVVRCWLVLQDAVFLVEMRPLLETIKLEVGHIVTRLNTVHCYTHSAASDHMPTVEDLAI